jgi:CheY-like chemotaxis protein/nitrogen-specific signal transduction histidine kinase
MSGVCMMVTRRKEAEIARLAAAEEASRLKDDFLATLSHELRTPLNAILGWVQMLQNGGLTAVRAKQAVDVIGRNARLQGQLIEDILDVSRIITGKLEMERAAVSVLQLVETVVSGIAPAVDAKHIRLELQIASELPPIEGDRKRLHQVLNNVLSNAVKFTPESGQIILACEATGEWLNIRVEDSGVGIAPEFLPFVFDRFRQADSRTTRTHGGLGLGLAIARHLIELHGGEISALSGGENSGTTISIRLPVNPTTAYYVPGDTMPLATNVRLDGVTLLVVDDQPDSREMLATLLEQHGARSMQTESAESALQILQAQRVDLLIADIAMPNVDGYELMRRLRAAGDETPAIAVTAFARSDDRRQALDCGYTHYLSKPIDGRQLAQTVREIVSASSLPQGAENV